MTVSLTSVLGKVMKQIVVENISRHVEDNVIDTGETYIKC